MVRAAGAREVHVRISCPPTISPCFYGVDTPSRSELIAATHSLEEITTYLDADSVGYLSLEGLMSAVGSQRGSYCSSCYTGVYPVPFPRDEASYLQLALKLVDKESTVNGTGKEAGRDQEPVGEKEAVANG
jgi:amidophosphoribosyltransferase